MLNMKCKICNLFDCGDNCTCICHNLKYSENPESPLTPEDEQKLECITRNDIILISEQTEVSYETAKRHLIKSKGDIAKAILSIGK